MRFGPIRIEIFDLLGIGNFNYIVVLEFDENAGLIMFPFDDTWLIPRWKLNNLAILLLCVELGVAESALLVDKAVFKK